MGERWYIDAKGHERETAQARRARLNRRKQLRDEYLADKTCVQCGSGQDLRVTWVGPFHLHSTGSIWCMGEEARNTYLENCRILCRKCDYAGRGRTRAVEHGGGKVGRKGCRCDLCTTTRSAYYRQRWQEKLQRRAKLKELKEKQ